MQNSVLILDFGSQYTQLIARRVRELNVYCEIYPFNKIPKDLSLYGALILSGSPHSVREKNSPRIDLNNLLSLFPTLAICYGAQLIAQELGGRVDESNIREYGRASLTIVNKNNLLFGGIANNTQVWMSHSDTIKELPKDSILLASTNDVDNVAYSINNRTFCLQFHPEVYHTKKGLNILQNFLIKICNLDQSWTPDSFVKKTIEDLRSKIGKDKVILGLSGGVDSSVAAILLQKAIGNNLHCIFVNNGLLRKNEYNNVLEQYNEMNLNIKGVDYSQQFYKELRGVFDPEMKRKIIGRLFIESFDNESNKIKNVKWLAQGTIYPDVIESISATGGPSATIKSHHNVGGLPDFMKLQVIEPLKLLFKDEVRRVGASLNIDKNILARHPFPGPGLAIRILGEIEENSVKMLQEVDDIFINGLKDEGLYDEVWQAGAILLPVKSVGVMGDERTYENAVALRSGSSTDGMTADWCHLPYEFLSKVSNKIINQVKGVNRVTYDISSKPPATIEWE